jgi:beta-galactosidase
LGVQTEDSDVQFSDNVFDKSGLLWNALICGSFAAPSFDTAFTDQSLRTNGIEPKAGASLDGNAWRAEQAGSGVFDLKLMTLPGPKTNCFALVSFWIFSPRSLDDLLAGSGMPRLDLLVGSDDGIEVVLNDKTLLVQKKIGPYVPDEFKIPNLPLNRGWNHFLIKVVQADGDWKFGGSLRSSDPDFVAKLKFALEKP